MNCPKFTVSIARKIMQLSIVTGNILKKVIVKLLKWRRIAVVKVAAATGVVKAVMGEGEGGNMDEDIQVASGVVYM